jgi:hypothetical protein
MDAFNVNWTAPFILNNKSDYFVEDFDILTTILSVLKWKEKNGSIKLYTDSVGFSYFEKIGILSLWDLGFDNDTLNYANKNINPRVFWAAGKLMALANEKCPIFMIDLDFIVWEKIPTPNNPLVVIHREDLIEDVYPSKEYLITPDNYYFDNSLSWFEPACNTAFVYFNDLTLKDYYVSEAFRYMVNNEADDRIIPMVFAEQRLLAMCAKKLNISIDCFQPNPFGFSNIFFTHIWGLKSRLKRSSVLRNIFCKRCINRIIHDFPEQVELLFNIPSLKQYLSDKEIYKRIKSV